MHDLFVGSILFSYFLITYYPLLLQLSPKKISFVLERMMRFERKKIIYVCVFFLFLGVYFSAGETVGGRIKKHVIIIIYQQQHQCSKGKIIKRDAVPYLINTCIQFLLKMKKSLKWTEPENGDRFQFSGARIYHTGLWIVTQQTNRMMMIRMIEHERKK